MALSNNTDLLASVAGWLARDDLTAVVPDLVVLFEATANRTLFHRKMETRTTLTVDTLSSDPEFIDLPADYQSMRRVRLSGVAGKPRLGFMTQTQLDDYRYSINNVSGQPVYYTIVGDELELAPTPAQDYEIELLYRANIPALGTNSTNWLMTLAPDYYLYGTLLSSAPYIQNDERIVVWGTGMQKALDELNKLSESQTFDAGPSTVSLPGVTP